MMRWEGTEAEDIRKPHRAGFDIIAKSLREAYGPRPVPEGPTLADRIRKTVETMVEEKAKWVRAAHAAEHWRNKETGQAAAWARAAQIALRDHANATVKFDELMEELEER